MLAVTFVAEPFPVQKAEDAQSLQNVLEQFRKDRLNKQQPQQQAPQQPSR